MTPRLPSAQTTQPITFQEPRYVNTIRLFRHGPGTGPRKAPSYQMDRTYSEVLRNAQVGLAEYPRICQEPNDEISTLEQQLERSSISRMPVDHQATITMPTSAIRTTEGYEGYAETLAFTPPSDVPAHLIPSTRNVANNCRGEPFPRDIL